MIGTAKTNARQQCLASGESDFAQARQALSSLSTRQGEALEAMAGVCRRQKAPLNAAGFKYFAAFLDRLLGSLLGAKKKAQESPPSRDAWQSLGVVLEQALTGVYSYYREVSRQKVDTAELAQGRLPLLAAIDGWTPFQAAKRPISWQEQTKSRLALFKEAVAKLPETPVESIRVVIGVCRTLGEAMKLAGFTNCAGYIQKIQSALLMIETRVSNRLGTAEDMQNLAVVLEDTLRDLTSYFREIDEYGGDAPERADARMDTATTLAGWRQSPHSVPAPVTAPMAKVRLLPAAALEEGKRGFPLMKEAIRNFLSHPLESVRAIEGVCRKLDESAQHVGFSHCARLVKRFSLALGRLENLFTARLPTPEEREVLQVLVEDVVRAVMAHYHEIAERGMVDLVESVEMRLEFVVPLESWQPSGPTEVESTSVDRARGFLIEAKKEARLFHEAVEGLAQHPQESIELLLGVCQRLSAGLRSDGYSFFAGHVSSIAAAIERIAQRGKPQLLSENALATLTIQLDDVQRGLASYLQEVSERGADAAECAEVRDDQVAALLDWSGEGTATEAPSGKQKSVIKSDAFFKEAERTVALLSEAISVVPVQPRESLGTALKLCHSLAARFGEMGFSSAGEYTQDIERAVSGLLDRLEPAAGGLDEVAILLDEVALSLVSYLEELKMRGSDAPECAEGRIFTVESLVAWTPPAGKGQPGAGKPAAVALYLVFEHRGRNFALPVDRVQEVVFSRGVYPLPFDRPDLSGLMNHRGQAVPVLRLSGDATGAPYVLMTRLDGTLCGFPAERVVRVMALDPRAFEKLPRAAGTSPWYSRQTKEGDRTLFIVDTGNGT